MNKFVCIHSHFYQPPRENPWLDEIERQPSAFPYHDWNQRIASECYTPNTASRILDEKDNIIDIVNNYSKISFNFGPTLLSWMEKNNSQTYNAIIAADRHGQKNFSGHGPAIAQCYNHIIMPLANTRDKETQVIWGIADFSHRFGRRPEGMWLPETAVDYETLEILAKYGISFVILSPYQAKAFRKKGEAEWKKSEHGAVDPKRAYECPLPSGDKIAVFFYDYPASNDLAFNSLLKSGAGFADRLVKLFDNSSNASQLIHIASDGETYGHHHKFGDMSLAFCINEIEKKHPVKVTIYAEYLEKCPPEYEVVIVENSAWSCAHGVGRWKEDCGCKIGVNPQWNQKWRAPLREALNRLSASLAEFYESRSKSALKNPWEARNDYISVILNREPESLNSFINKNCHPGLSDLEKIKIIYLMEMQRYAMFMFTSCGWFFDELSGIETVQIIQYASRAIEMCAIAGGPNLENEFRSALELIPSNIREFGNGGYVYDKFVRSAKIGFQRLAAHYACSALFVEPGKKQKLYCYTAFKEDFSQKQPENGRFVYGRVKLEYSLTGEDSVLAFAAFYGGQTDLVCGVKNAADTGIAEHFQRAVSAGSFSDVTQAFKKEFKDNIFMLDDLLVDDQVKILENIFKEIESEHEKAFSRFKADYYPMILKMKELRVPYSSAFSGIIEDMLHKKIKKYAASAALDMQKIKSAAAEILRLDFRLHKKELSKITAAKINSMVEQFTQNPKDTAVMDDILANLIVSDTLGLYPDVWQAQNILFCLTKTLYPKMLLKKEEGDEHIAKWIDLFNVICGYLKIKIN